MKGKEVDQNNNEKGSCILHNMTDVGEGRYLFVGDELSTDS